MEPTETATPLDGEERVSFLDGILANEGRIGDAGAELRIDSARFWATVMSDEGFARAVAIAIAASQVPPLPEEPGTVYDGA